MPGRFVTLLVLAIACTGCTNKQVYEIIQSNERLECQKIVRQIEYEECMRRFNQSYEDYQQEREQVLKGEE